MWEMAPNEQNWEGDSICCSRTDSVCIGSCWMQPARLRPVEQECCTRRGVGTAWLRLPQLQSGRQRLTPGQQDPAGIYCMLGQAVQSQALIPAAQNCTPSSPSVLLI